jgi:hypothetical protein
MHETLPRYDATIHQSPKLFLAPAKGGGAPPDACRVGGATASSWAVGGAPHMSPTPIWLVAIVARRPSGRRG